MLRKELVGTWKLAKFANMNDKGDLQYWNGELNGYLIYSSDCFVTAAINRSRNKSGKTEYKNSFYVAQANLINDNTIEHKIVVSSEPSRVGSSHIRTFCFQDSALILKGKGLTGEVALTWLKVKKN